MDLGVYCVNTTGGWRKEDPVEVSAHAGRRMRNDFET